MSSIIEIKNLTITPSDHSVPLTDQISFHMKKGKITALVGESGSGKTLSALSIAGLLPSSVGVKMGECIYNEQNLYALPDDAMRALRGKKISVVFQEPMTSLNPLHKVGRQIQEMLETHGSYSKKTLHEKIITLLKTVQIPDPEKKIKSYPHELSGGQRQRIMIAMAIANNPDILILDEPTTALDATIQTQIIDLLKNLQQEYNMSMLLISHDLNMVARTADYIYVMQKGKIVESGSKEKVFSSPQEAYTKALIDAVPKGHKLPVKESVEPVLSVRNIQVTYPIYSGLLRQKTGDMHAVQDISFTLKKGETIGIIGESGSGKSSFASALLHLIPFSGEVILDDVDLHQLTVRQLRQKRRFFQPVFQDPYAALSPRMTVKQIIAEGLDLHFPQMTAQEKESLIRQYLSEVGLKPFDVLERYPHEFSGGQRQRIAIARALVMHPKILILDEPTSALDRTVQKNVLDLLNQLQEKYGLSYIFITHDLSVIRAIAHQLIVMKDGKVLEMGACHDIFKAPEHAYTKMLMDAHF